MAKYQVHWGRCYISRYMKKLPTKKYKFLQKSIDFVK